MLFEASAHGSRECEARGRYIHLLYYSSSGLTSVRVPELEKRHSYAHIYARYIGVYYIYLYHDKCTLCRYFRKPKRFSDNSSSTARRRKVFVWPRSNDKTHPGVRRWGREPTWRRTSVSFRDIRLGSNLNLLPPNAAATTLFLHCLCTGVEMSREEIHATRALSVAADSLLARHILLLLGSFVWAHSRSHAFTHTRIHVKKSLFLSLLLLSNNSPYHPLTNLKGGLNS